jgi:hypothetical protein
MEEVIVLSSARTYLMNAVVRSTRACVVLGVLTLSMGSGQPRADETSDLNWARVKEADHWTEIVTNAVTATTLPEAIPADITTFCAAYKDDSTADRIHFWVGLIAAIAGAETQGRFNPRDSYTESFHKHGPQSPLVVSRGLLQLSFPGDRDHYRCAIPDAESLYDPSVNLACGVKVLAKLATRDERIAGRVGSDWKGGAAYWSTLRSEGGKGDSNARNLAAIVHNTQALSVCRAGN